VFITNKDEDFSLYECAACAVQFWTPFRNPGPEWYARQEQYRIENPRLYRGYHKLFLARHLPASPARLLDLGCGDGALVARLATLKHEAWGVDANPANIETARRFSGLPHFHAMPLDAFLARPDLPRFDVITFFEVIEHLDAPLAFARQVRRLLAPGGRAVLSTPSRERFRPDLYAWDDPPNHLSRWNEEAIRRLFGRVGLEIVSVAYVDQYLHFRDLCAGFSRGIAEASKRIRGAYRVQSFFLEKIPARVLQLISFFSRAKNGVMVVELRPVASPANPA
jgi:SAM-dependent methyltransferase